MKCVKNKEEYRRVTDVEAVSMVANGWMYCKKTEYRGKMRPVKAVKGEKEVKERVEKVERSSVKKEKGYSKYREKMANN